MFSLLEPLFADRPDQTPEAVARRRKQAEAMLSAGQSTAPIGHWTQGLARLAQTVVGSLDEARADDAEAAGRKDWWARAGSDGGIFGLGGSSPAASGSAANGTGDTLSSTSPATPGGQPVVSASQAVNDQIPSYGRAMLDTIAGTESPGYNTLYGGKTFDGYSAHPDIRTPITSGPNAGKVSTAAGRYQMLAGTWNEQANRLGLKDFSPANQDAAAWDLAKTSYQKNTGRSLDEDLQSGDPAKIASIGGALRGVWTSLPGGIEAGTNTSRFAQAYQGNLGRYGTGGQQAAAPPQGGMPAATVAAAAAAQAPPPNQVASLDPSLTPQSGGQAPGQPSPEAMRGIAAVLTPGAGASPPAARSSAFVPGEQAPATSASTAPPAGMTSLPGAALPGGPVPLPPADPRTAAQPSPTQAIAATLTPPAGGAAPAPMPTGPTADIAKLLSLASDPWAPAGAQQWLGGIIQQRLKPVEYGFATTPDGTILRQNPRTGQVEPVYQSTPKPDVDIREDNGRIIATDRRTLKAQDVTPDGIPASYRDLTSEERTRFGIPSNAPAKMTKDGPVLLSGASTTINNGPGPSSKVFETMSARSDDARAAQSSIQGFASAKQALDSGQIILGAGADMRLGLAKVGAMFGLPPEAAANTETFRASMAPVVLGLVKGLGSGSGISNADRDFAERAAAGSITLEPATIKRMIDIGQRAAEAKVRDFNATLDDVYPDTPENGQVRSLFKLRPGAAGMPAPDLSAGQGMGSGPAASIGPPTGQAPASMAATPTAPQGQPVRVGSPAEASRLPPGTLFVTPDGRQFRVPRAGAQ